jgi:NADPH2:quinone reductase
VEGAGEVTAVGGGVSGFEVGDRVAWSDSIGSYAEQNTIPARSVVPIPDGVETKTAAAVLLQGLTAHYLATDTFGLNDSHTCLIHAGAGGVGLLLTQIAVMKGARVITTVGTNDKARLSKAAGADHVIVYTETNFTDAVEELVGRRSLDVVYDGVGAATFEGSIDLLRPRGMMVTFGNASGPVPAVSPLTLMQKGSLFLTRPTLGDYVSTRKELTRRADDLFDWLASGKLKMRIGGEYALEKAAEAHRALQARETTGKLLILP